MYSLKSFTCTMEMSFQALKSLNNAQNMQNVGICCTKFLLLKIRLIWSHNWETNQNLRKQQFLAKYLVKISHGKVTNMHSRGRVLAVFLSFNSKKWRRIYWKVCQSFSCCYQRYCWFIFYGSNEFHFSIRRKIQNANSNAIIFRN